MKVIKVLTVVTLAIVMGACATTQKARNVETSGFLDDYSSLSPEGGGALVYRSPTLRASDYGNVILEPVTLWTEGSQLADVSYEDQQALGHALYEALKSEISKTHTIVDKPDGRTLRIRPALTEAKKSIAALNMVTTIMPVGLVISHGKKLATGTHSFAGAASGEVEVLDADTGEVVLAAVSRRVGGKTLRGSASTWGDVESSFEVWAKNLAAMLNAE